MDVVGDRAGVAAAASARSRAKSTQPLTPTTSEAAINMPRASRNVA